MGALSLLVSEKVSEQVNLIVGLPEIDYEPLKDRYINSIRQLHL